MQLKGTGKDPLGRYIRGQVFDVRVEEVEELVKAGFAELIGDDVTDKRKVEIANAMVRGDPLTHPHDQKVAEGFRDVNQPSAVDTDGKAVTPAKRAGDQSPHDVVHTSDPAAKPGASELSPEEARERQPQPEVTVGTDGLPAGDQRPGETGGQTAAAGGTVQASAGSKK